MRRAWGLVALFVWPAVAAGQGLVPGATSLTLDADDGGEPVTVRAQDCRRLVTHVPAADVAYQPGVDVAGNPVTPADIGPRFQGPAVEDVVINVEIDLREKYGIPPSLGRHRSIVTVGRVVFQNGKPYFNGQPLESDDEQALVAACRRSGF